MLCVSVESVLQSYRHGLKLLSRLIYISGDGNSQMGDGKTVLGDSRISSGDSKLMKIKVGA